MTMISLTPASLVLASVVALAGCADDPVSYSDPVGIKIKVESDKVVNDSITSDKSITTESGNPYGAFVSDAEAALGRSPSRIEVDTLTFELGASSTGASALAQVFDGEVSVLFELDTTDDSFEVGTVTIGAEHDDRGPVALDATFSSDGMSDQNYTKLLGGSFKVVLFGPTHADFDTLGAKLDTQLTISFVAYE